MPDFLIEGKVWLATAPHNHRHPPKKRSFPLFTTYNSINSSFIAPNHLEDLSNTYLIRFWYKYFKKAVFSFEGCLFRTYAWHTLPNFHVCPGIRGIRSNDSPGVHFHVLLSSPEFDFHYITIYYSIKPSAVLSDFLIRSKDCQSRSKRYFYIKNFTLNCFAI